MQTFEHRVSIFMIQFLRMMKEKSGGYQRWNDICEDIATLYANKYTSVEGPYTREEIWRLFFEPPSHENNVEQERLEKALEDPFFCHLFFVLFQASFDPPASWWREQ